MKSISLFNTLLTKQQKIDFVLFFLIFFFRDVNRADGNRSGPTILRIIVEQQFV